MARQLRLHVPGGFYHVTLRGNHRQPVFFTERDRDLLDDVVAEAISKLGGRVHAYCWMTNHIHLLMQVSDVPLGRIILCIASRYARTVQKRIDTTGHLFERRYHAVLVDADNYLLTVVRYIHLNPVSAGLVSDASHYCWSSHRAYLGRRQQAWVTTEFALRLIAVASDTAKAGYRNLMGDQEPLNWGTGMLTPHSDHPQILGGDEFVSRVVAIRKKSEMSNTLEELVIECSKRFGLAPESLMSMSRARELCAARAWFSHEAVAGRVASASAVARHFGRSETAIRRLMARHPRTTPDQ